MDSRQRLIGWWLSYDEKILGTFADQLTIDRQFAYDRKILALLSIVDQLSINRQFTCDKILICSLLSAI